MSDQIEQLSEREREILKQVATGASNQQIAGDLNISVNTVKVHIRNVFGKLGVASRTEATLFAVRSGLIHTAQQAENGGTGEPPDDTAIAAPTEHHPAIVAPATPEPPATPTAQAPTPVPAAQPASRGIVVQPLLLIVIVMAAAFLGAGLAMLMMRSADQPIATTDTGVAPEASAAPASSYPAPMEQRSERWRALPPLPDNLEGAAAASLSGQIYVIGGERNGEIVGDVWRYDPAVGNWQQVASKLTAVRDAQAAVLNGRIYVPGGHTASGVATQIVEVFDPASGWSEAEPLLQPRAAYSLAVLEGQMFLFGGLYQGEEQASVYRYDGRSETDTWDELTPMPTARAYSGAIAVEGRIFVFGGERNGVALDVTEQYVPANEERGTPWSIRASLPEPRGRFGLGTISGQVYLFGGTAPRPLVRYDFRNDSWTVVASDISPGLQPAVASRDAALYLVLGGGPGRSSSDFFQFEEVFTVRVTLP
jgi:DNA-binding CsgD family transcriptional regulator